MSAFYISQLISFNEVSLRWIPNWNFYLILDSIKRIADPAVDM